MENVVIEKAMEASRPVLACFSKISNDLPKTTYVVYYRNHMYEDEEVYKNLDELRQLFLPNHELQLKIINFEKQELPVIIKNSDWQCKGNSIIIAFKYLDFSIVLTGLILNQSESNEGLVNLSLSQKKGYDEFYKFRKKYKTLENITKKIDFQIDHRIKVIISGKEHQFDLEDKKKQHYFLNLGSFDESFTIVLEETTSIEDFIQVEKVEEVQVSLPTLKQAAYSYKVKVTFNRKFQVTFLFNLIKNQNFSSADFVSIRVLEISSKAGSVKIGSQQTISLNDCLKIQPLIGNKFYDYEWGYLHENLSKIQGSSNIYEYLDKITKSVPQYAHFVNQEVIDLKSSNFIIFEIEGTKIKVPIVYILKGFNYIQTQKLSLKFFIDSSRLESKQALRQKSDKKRVYELNLLEIWNLNKLNKLLDRNNTNNFIIKIINEDTYYFIPFERKIVSKSEFRKESKELLIRNEITQKSDSNYYSIQNHGKNKDQLVLIQSTSILPFYLIKTTSSSSISVQIIIANSIALEGSLSKEKIMGNEGKSLIHLLTSVEGNSKIGIVLSLSEVDQPNDSAATYFDFKHRLQFAEAGETEEVIYDIEIQFEKESKLRSLKSKLSPEVKRQANDAVLLREFTGHSGVYRKEQTLNFTLKLRKMYFNQELNYFDNDILVSKSISINPNADMLKNSKNVMIRLQKQHYEGIQFDLYDENVKKRMKYYLQIYADKNEFLDFKDSSYKFKIPSPLWKFNNSFNDSQSAYTLTTHLNRKSKNSDQQTFNQNHLQEFNLNHYNYNDGLSLVKPENSLAYSKFFKAIKLKCDIMKDKIGWSPQSQWYFGVLSFPQENFYFLAQRMFDPYEEKRNNSESSSRKTVSRERSNRSDKHKIDPLAKTINNLDLFKLKQKKNEIIAQGRQLTARYVKRQEKIVELTKKLLELEQSIKKRDQEESEFKANRKMVKKENVKMREFYRSICECGARNPQFNGYCDVCLKQLKQKYETYTKQYNAKCYQYEKIVFDRFNKKEKIEKLKKKIGNMKNQNIVVQAQDENPQVFIKDLEEKGLRKTIEDLKVEIFEIEEEKNSLVSTSNWQMSILEEKISREDDKIYKASQEYDSLKNKLADLLKITRKGQQLKLDDI